MAVAEQNQIQVIIVDDNAEQRKSLTLLLGFEDDIEVVGEAGSGEEGVQLVRALRPNIVLMDINLPDMDGIRATDLISREVPGTGVIMMSIQGEPDYLRRSMLAGARNFLVKPFTSDELTSIIREVYAAEASRPKIAPTTAKPAEAAQELPPGTHQARIIAVYSPKGGVGRTTIAVNLAIALKQVTSANVALVDASLLFGDVGVLLNANSKTTILDLVRVADQLDERTINMAAFQHNSGVAALLAPLKPEQSEQVTASVIKQVFDAMIPMFDYIIVDTFPSLSDTTLAVLDAADKILLVMTLEMPVIKNITLFMDVANALSYSKGKVDLVVNRSGRDQTIRPEHVEQSVRHAVNFTIAEDARLVNLSVNQGVPFLVSSRDAPISKSIIAMAEKLSGSEAREPVASAEGARAPARPTGRFGFLTRRG